MKLKNKVAVVTGGSRGIGEAIVNLFASEGAKVIFTYYNSDVCAKRIKRNSGMRGYEISAIKSDVSNVDEIKELIKLIRRMYGRVDIIVNNAGIYSRNRFSDSTEEIWDKTINTNLKGAFFISMLAVEEGLMQKKGKIINISSNASFQRKNRKGIEYGVSKAAMNYLTKSLDETYGENIYINCIAPGYVETDMALFKGDAELKSEIEKSIPSGRVNTPEDIAKAVLILAVPESTKKGEIIEVNGGISERRTSDSDLRYKMNLVSESRNSSGILPKFISSWFF